MPIASGVPRITIEQAVIVTPTITAGAYTAGMQLGGIQTLANVVRTDVNNIGIGTAMLTEVTILDKAAQSAAIDIWFFNILPTIASSDHATFNITDANLVASCIGVVSVGGSYSSSSANSISSTTNLNKQVRASSGTTIYAVAVIRASATYASVSDLQFQYCFLVD